MSGGKVDGTGPWEATESIEKSSRKAPGLVRAYNDDSDRDAVLRLCEGVFGGKDYLPKRLSFFVGDEASTPVVLQVSETSDVVAFANFRRMHPPSAGPCAPIFLEAVRVDPERYGNGFGTAVVEEGLRFVREKSGAEATRVVSVTRMTNTPMIRVFRKIGFRPCGGGRLCIWPSFTTFGSEDMVRTPEVPMLDVLGADDSISASMRAELDMWLPVLEKHDFFQTFAAVSSCEGASGLIPQYYGVCTSEYAWDAIAACRSTAWRLPDRSSLIVLYEDPAVTSSVHRTMVGICASSVSAAAAAVVFVDRRLCIRRFRAIVDATVQAEVLSDAPIFRQSPFTDFDAFGLSL